MNLPGMGDPADWQSRWYDSKLTLMLTPPSHGWIDMALMGTPRGNLTEVHFSFCFDDFYEILKWVQQVAVTTKRTKFEMNEEGPFVRFMAVPVLGRPGWTQFWIRRFSSDEEDNPLPSKVLFRCRLERHQLAHEFYRRWEQWIREDYDADAWANRSPRDPAESNRPFSDARTLKVLSELRNYLECTHLTLPDSLP